jgi:hypothetical protein
MYIMYQSATQNLYLFFVRITITVIMEIKFPAKPQTIPHKGYPVEDVDDDILEHLLKYRVLSGGAAAVSQEF